MSSAFTALVHGGVRRAWCRFRHVAACPSYVPSESPFRYPLSLWRAVRERQLFVSQPSQTFFLVSLRGPTEKKLNEAIKSGLLVNRYLLYHQCRNPLSVWTSPSSIMAGSVPSKDLLEAPKRESAIFPFVSALFFVMPATTLVCPCQGECSTIDAVVALSCTTSDSINES